MLTLLSTTVDQQQVSWLEKTFMPLSAVTCVPPNRKIYGDNHLPEAYCFMTVPEGVPLKPCSQPSDMTRSTDLKNMELGSRHSVPKILVGLVQTLIGAMTLYKAQGNQISQYGFTAFGLSVVPYAFMLLVNIITALVTPEYSCMYLIHTPDMDDAVKDGGRFGETFASVDVEAVQEPIPSFTDEFNLKYGLFLVLLVLAPLAIVGALSKFQVGSSSSSQRGWMLSWLVVGSACSLWMAFIAKSTKGMTYYWRPLSLRDKAVAVAFLCITTLPLWVPAIGGMVTVGLMIQEYGICTKLDF